MLALSPGGEGGARGRGTQGRARPGEMAISAVITVTVTDVRNHADTDVVRVTIDSKVVGVTNV